MLSRGGATAWSVVEPLLLGGDHVEGGDWSGDGDEMASTLLWSREPRSCQPQHQPGPGRCHWSGLRIDWWRWQCVWRHQPLPPPPHTSPAWSRDESQHLPLARSNHLVSQVLIWLIRHPVKTHCQLLYLWHFQLVLIMIKGKQTTVEWLKKAHILNYLCK